ncbi:MAG: alpha/beta hydrolase [Bacteroidales bacterium]|nr:alpha/beta hydrolase [Bacteroidales bacterium]
MSKTRFITHNNYRISYTSQGLGKNLVLLHGFLESKSIWNRFSEHLSKEYRVIAIDLPGHGESDMQAEIHTMELMAESIKAVLDNLSIDNAVIIGHSMGAYISLALADMYPEIINGLGIFHSHALADTPEGKINRGRAIQVVKDNHKNFISMFIPDLFTKENQQKYKTDIEKLQEEARNISKESVIASLEGMRHRTDKLSLLSKLEAPICFIIGKQDPRAPLKKMMDQISIPKHAEILILKDVAHMGYIEDFETTVSFIDSFVGRC